MNKKVYIETYLCIALQPVYPDLKSLRVSDDIVTAEHEDGSFTDINIKGLSNERILGVLYRKLGIRYAVEQRNC